MNAYLELGARCCEPVYNALDPETHFPVSPDPRFSCDLCLAANRLPDRETRIEEFFLKPAERLSESKFLLAGNGWGDKPMPSNVARMGHLFTRDHNSFNSSAKAVLNVNRESMARYGFSPPTRIFEAAGAAACVISDAWKGIELFLEPDREVLIAHSGAEVADTLRDLSPTRAREIGQAAYRRVLAEHTYEHRVSQLERLLAVTPRVAAQTALPGQNANQHLNPRQVNYA